MLDSLTPEVFDALIVGTIVIGVALAAVRVYADLSRPLPPPSAPQPPDEPPPA